MKNSVLIIVALISIFLTIGCSKSPDAEQIKKDLIGNEMGDMYSGVWKFESLSEFQELIINGKNEQGDLIEYDVIMHLIGSRSKPYTRGPEGKLYSVNALVVYKKIDGDWTISSILRKSLKEIN